MELDFISTSSLFHYQKITIPMYGQTPTLVALLMSTKIFRAAFAFDPVNQEQNVAYTSKTDTCIMYK